MFSLMLVLATASALRPGPTEAPPGPRPTAARLQSPAVWADRTRRGPSRVGRRQIWAGVDLVPAAHAHSRRSSTQTASDCAKELLCPFGKAACWFSAADRALVRAAEWKRKMEKGDAPQMHGPSLKKRVTQRARQVTQAPERFDPLTQFSIFYSNF
jgi:hypothetical protein